MLVRDCGVDECGRMLETVLEDRDLFMTPLRLTGWQVVSLAACFVSPFWFLASDWRDGSEFRATVLGAALAGGMVAILRIARGGDR